MIGGLRHYALTILDLFSRYLVAWGIFKTITQREVKNLLAFAVIARLSFSKSTGATWKKPNRKEDKSGFLLIRNQKLFTGNV